MLNPKTHINFKAHTNGQENMLKSGSIKVFCNILFRKSEQITNAQKSGRASIFDGKTHME